jgi:hypothetical protein
MTWQQLAGSCENGPCPTFYIDDETGNVRVQGNRTTAHVAMPDHEDMIEIPAAAWRKLLSQVLPPATP